MPDILSDTDEELEKEDDKDDDNYLDKETTEKESKENQQKQENNDKSINFSEEEQRKIVELVCTFAEQDRSNLKEWKEKKKKALLASYDARPSTLEDLNKKSWMSDRNVGVCGATCASLKSVFFASCYNPDSIHAVPTEVNDVDKASNVEKFTKAVLSDPRNKFEVEFNDFCDNLVRSGVAFLKCSWKIDEKYVDKRIWHKGKIDIKEAEKVRFEYARITNIANVDDILCPDNANDINDLDHFIEVVHLYGSDLNSLAKRKTFLNVDDTLRAKICNPNIDSAGLDKIKQEENGAEKYSDSNLDFMYKEIDVLEAYFSISKNGREEKYRFHIHEETKTFLSGKPLRSIVPSGRLPYVVCQLDKLSGKLRGKSMPELGWDISNQINTVFNQKTDFQYIKNCPFGFYDPSDPNVKGSMELTPNMLYPTSSPQSVSIHSGGASDSWAIQDIQFLMEMYERISGSASYFLTSNSQDSTATRDKIVANKSDTRMAIWVKGIVSSFASVLNIQLELYQAFAPEDLGTRILGSNGKSLFENFSAEQIQGYYDIKMSPDIVAGSKAYKASIAMNRYALLSKNPLVMNYPTGLWNLTSDTLKDTGTDFPDKYLPKEPKDAEKIDDEIENEFFRIQQGEVIEPPEGESPEAENHLNSHMKQYEKIHFIPEEHREKFDDHIFLTQRNVANFKSKMINEQFANQLISGGMNNESGFNANQGASARPSIGNNVGEIQSDSTGAGIDETTASLDQVTS